MPGASGECGVRMLKPVHDRLRDLLSQFPTPSITAQNAAEKIRAAINTIEGEIEVISWALDQSKAKAKADATRAKRQAEQAERERHEAELAEVEAQREADERAEMLRQKAKVLLK